MLIEEADRPLTEERWDKKLATSISLGLSGWMLEEEHQDNHAFQCEAYTERVPGRCASEIRSRVWGEAPNADSAPRTEAKREG